MPKAARLGPPRPIPSSMGLSSDSEVPGRLGVAELAQLARRSRSGGAYLPTGAFLGEPVCVEIAMFKFHPIWAPTWTLPHMTERS